MATTDVDNVIVPSASVNEERTEREDPGISQGEVARPPGETGSLSADTKAVFQALKVQGRSCYKIVSLLVIKGPVWSCLM